MLRILTVLKTFSSLVGYEPANIRSNGTQADCLRSAAPRDHRHTPVVGKQAREDGGGHPTPDSVCERGCPRPDGLRSDRQAPGLHFTLAVDTGSPLRDYDKRNAYLTYGPDGSSPCLVLFVQILRMFQTTPSFVTALTLITDQLSTYNVTLL